MRKGRFSEEQIIGILQECESGVPLSDLCRKHGVSTATFYNWRKKFGGLEVDDARKLRQLEDENRRLKKLVAEQALDNEALRAALKKKW